MRRYSIAGTDQWSVPEPDAKEYLASFGVPVPANETDTKVVKAFGPGIVHKSDVGAVRVRIPAAEVDEVRKAVVSSLAEHGLAPDGFLVEDMAEPGVEMIIGVVDRGYGPMLAIGFGGTLTELLDDVSLRCLPVTERDVRSMIAELRGAKLLDAWRGRAAVDVDALVSTALGIAEAAQALGDELAELEANPVIVHERGATAVDARIILKPGQAASTTSTDFAALFRPRGIAVAGASTSKESFGNRALDAYRDYGWSDGLVALHPTATEVNGVPAYASVAAVPFPVDYVVAAVPATACAQLVRDAAGHAPFVHVISGGFREASEGGAALEAVLLDAAREVGVRVLGPNCMGVFCPEGRQTFQKNAPTERGHVSIISQSGGLAGDIIKGGAVRGIAFAKLVSIGNAIDVTVGELLGWLLDDAETKVIGLYLEDQRNGAALVEALRRARGRKPVVVLAGGLSRQGGQAAASHTGALAGDERVWRAISASTGTTVVETLEEFLGVLTFLQRSVDDAPAAYDSTTLVVGVGGGASVLATDACDRAGLNVVPVDAAVQESLRAMGYGAGTSVRNPIEIPFGPAAPLDAFARVLTPILATQHYRDVLVHVNVQSYYSFGTGGGDRLIPVAGALADLQWPGVRVTFVGRNSDCAPSADADALFAACRDKGVLAYRTLGEAAAAIAAGQRFDRSREG